MQVPLNTPHHSLPNLQDKPIRIFDIGDFDVPPQLIPSLQVCQRERIERQWAHRLPGRNAPVQLVDDFVIKRLTPIACLEAAL